MQSRCRWGGQEVATHLPRFGLLAQQHALLIAQLSLLEQQLIAQPGLLRLQQPRLQVRRPRLEPVPLAQLVCPNAARVEGGPAFGWWGLLEPELAHYVAEGHGCVARKEFHRCIA